MVMDFQEIDRAENGWGYGDIYGYGQGDGHKDDGDGEGCGAGLIDGDGWGGALNDVLYD
jgi:hypothetical protein